MRAARAAPTRYLRRPRVARAPPSRACRRAAVAAAVLFAARRTRRRRASFWAGAATAGASAARGRRAAATAATRRAGGRLPTAFPSTKVSGHWSKPSKCGSGPVRNYASQAVVRRVAMMTNLDSFVKQALTHVGQVGKFTGTRFTHAGPKDKIQVNLEPGEHPVTPLSRRRPPPPPR